MIKMTNIHYGIILLILEYCIGTCAEGLTLASVGIWDGLINFESDVVGYRNSEYTKVKLQWSVNEWLTFLCGSPFMFWSKMMPIITLLVIKAKLFAAVLYTQDMLFEMQVFVLLGIKAKLTIRLFC